MVYETAYVVVYIATFRANLLAVISKKILSDVSSDTLIGQTTKLHCITFVITSQVIYFFIRDKLFRNCYSKPRYRESAVCDSVEGGSYWSSIYSLISAQIDTVAILYFLR